MTLREPSPLSPAFFAGTVLVQFLPMILAPLLLALFPSPFTRPALLWGLLAVYALAKGFKGPRGRGSLASCSVRSVRAQAWRTCRVGSS